MSTAPPDNTFAIKGPRKAAAHNKTAILIASSRVRSLLPPAYHTRSIMSPVSRNNRVGVEVEWRIILLSNDRLLLAESDSTC